MRINHTWAPSSPSLWMNQSPPSPKSLSVAPDKAADLAPGDTIFRELFEGAPIGMALLALDERFLRVNASFCKMVGYSNEELRERTAEDITFADDIETGRQLAQDLLDGTARFTGDKRYIHRNGDVLWVSRTASVIRDDQGQPQHFLLMVEDISERKASEAALSKNRRALEAAHLENQLIMDNSQDVICTVSEDGRFVKVSAACEQLWGYTAEELEGRPYIDFVYAEDGPKTETVLKN